MKTIKLTAKSPITRLVLEQYKKILEGEKPTLKYDFTSLNKTNKEIKKFVESPRLTDEERDAGLDQLDEVIHRVIAESGVTADTSKYYKYIVPQIIWLISAMDSNRGVYGSYEYLAEPKRDNIDTILQIISKEYIKNEFAEKETRVDRWIWDFGEKDGRTWCMEQSGRREN